MRLIVGLGNPGPKYRNNRHNVGFMAVDEIVRRHSFAAWRARFQAEVCEGTVAGQKCLVMKPTTFMNESGRAVGEAARFFKIPGEDIVVLYDELDLAPTKIKIKQGGGAAGHNGLRSLDQHLGGDIGKAYLKLRIGIGHPGDKSKVHGHVLGDFAKSEQPDFERLLEDIAEAFPVLIERNGPDFLTKLALIRNPKPVKAKPPGDATQQTNGGSPLPKDQDESANTALGAALAKARDALKKE